MKQTPEANFDDATITKLDELARFVAVFAAPDFSFAEWRNSEPDEPGVRDMPFVEYSKTAIEFVEMAYASGIIEEFDWPKWTKTSTAKRLLRSPTQIAKATPEQMFRLLTVYVRGDRFNEGMLLSAFESGFLMAIVGRAEAICSGLRHR
jgi:hypothetical protein